LHADIPLPVRLQQGVIAGSFQSRSAAACVFVALFAPARAGCIGSIANSSRRRGGRKRFTNVL
jgi:hypothetical protein